MATLYAIKSINSVNYASSIMSGSNEECCSYIRKQAADGYMICAFRRTAASTTIIMDGDKVVARYAIFPDGAAAPKTLGECGIVAIGDSKLLIRSEAEIEKFANVKVDGYVAANGTPITEVPEWGRYTNYIKYDKVDDKYLDVIGYTDKHEDSERYVWRKCEVWATKIVVITE